MLPNFVLLADSYKYNHHLMYPKHILKTYSVLYARKWRIDTSILDNKICIFGVRNALEILEKSFSNLKYNGKEGLETLKDFLKDSGDLKHIDSIMNDFSKLIECSKTKQLNDILNINAVEDGSFIGVDEPIITIENKIKDFVWLPNYLETYLNSSIWKPSYVATQAAIFAKTALNFGLDYKNLFHDFSARGMSGYYDIAFSNMAHLLFFNGSDSIPAIQRFKQLYTTNEKIGVSIPASEHSVMCLGGKENEVQTYCRLVKEFDESPISIVSDTWDLFGILDKLKESTEFMNLLTERKYPVVIRPDSGDPVKILCGDSEHDDNRYKKGVIDICNRYFGNKVKVVYGDSITVERFKNIYMNLKNKNLIHNLTLGIGSFTYNYATRDTVGFVTKMTYAEDENNSYNLKKEPITCSWKKSITGKVEIKNQLKFYSNSVKELRSFDDIREYCHSKLKDL